MSSRCGATAATSRWYAPDEMVPTVPITPTRWLRVASTSDATPGSMTPTTGTGSSACSSSSAAAVAVLQATTTTLTSCTSTSHRLIWWAKPRTSSSGRGP